jgi:spore germination protein KB
MKNISLTTLQLFALIFVQIAGTSLLIIPGAVVSVAGVDSWISLIISTLLGLLVGLMVFYMYKNFPAETLIGVFEKITGKILGKILGFGFVLYCLISLSTVIKQACSITGHIFLPETSTVTLFIVYFVIVVYIIKMGITVLARTNILVTIFLILSFIVILIGAIPMFDVPLKPVLAEGFSPVIIGSLSPASWMGQIILITMIFPFLIVDDKKKIKRTIIYSLIIVGVMNTLVTVVTLGVYGLETKDLYFPVYNVTKLIEYEIFWRRLDVIIMFAWVIGVTLKISFWFYCMVAALKQLLNLDRLGPIVIPTALLMFTIGFFAANNSTELSYVLGRVYPLFSLLTYEFLIPFLICVLIFIRKKREVTI